MTNGTPLNGLGLEPRHAFLQECQLTVEGILVTGYTVGVILLVIFEISVLVISAVGTAVQMLSYPLVCKGES
jgi:hypothetical protein